MRIKSSHQSPSIATCVFCRTCIYALAARPGDSTVTWALGAAAHGRMFSAPTLLYS